MLFHPFPRCLEPVTLPPFKNGFHVSHAACVVYHRLFDSGDHPWRTVVVYKVNERITLYVTAKRVDVFLEHVHYFCKGTVPLARARCSSSYSLFLSSLFLSILVCHIGTRYASRCYSSSCSSYASSYASRCYSSSCSSYASSRDNFELVRARLSFGSTFSVLNKSHLD